MLPISNKSMDTEGSVPNPITAEKVQLMKWEKKSMKPNDGVITWAQPSGCNGVHETAIFTVNKIFGASFYVCRKEKRKAREVVDVTVLDLDSPIQKRRRK